MNRRNFLSKLVLGAAAITVAPQILIPKDKPTVMGIKEMLDMRNSLMNSIANIPVSQWGTMPKPWNGSDEESWREIQKNMEWGMMFGERRKSNRKFMTGIQWTSSL